MQPDPRQRSMRAADGTHTSNVTTGRPEPSAPTTGTHRFRPTGTPERPERKGKPPPRKGQTDMYLRPRNPNLNVPCEDQSELDGAHANPVPVI